MKITYTKLIKGQWIAECGTKPLAKISAVEREDGWQVWVSDLSNPIPVQIPGSPFESINMAKAAIEYHFKAKGLAA